MLPLALALVAAAALADRTPFAPEPASQAWGAIHGIALLLGTLAVMVGFVAGLMYLVQARAAEAQAAADSRRFACPASNGWSGSTAA